MKTNSDEKELYMNAFALELPSGATLMTLFHDKQSAMAFAEKAYDTSGDDCWDKIRKKHKLKIVKVVVRKENW